jgi:hypothetical protein
MAVITEGLNMSCKSVYIRMLWEYGQVDFVKWLVHSSDKDGVISDSILVQKENW